MRTLAVIASCCIAGCAWTPASPAADGTLKLAVSQRVTIEDTGLTLAFRAVKEDSRCPRGAQCIQAGQATVAIDVSKPDGASQSLTLTLPRPATASCSGYAISLVALEPYPAVGHPVSEQAYVATLKVVKE